MKWNDGLETTLSKKEDSRLTEDKNLEVETCIIQLEDDCVVKLDEASLKQIVDKGMKACGCLNKKKVKQVLIKNKGAEL